MAVKKETKTAKKVEVKKAACKKECAKKEAPKKVEKKVETSKKEPARRYVLNKRASDGMWTVKFAGGEKVIKLFKTKVEAEEYTKVMAENQGGSQIGRAHV